MNLTKTQLFTEIEVHHIFLDPWDERLYSFNSFHDRAILKNLNWQEFKEFRKPVKGKTSTIDKLLLIGLLILIIGGIYYVG